MEITTLTAIILVSALGTIIGMSEAIIKHNKSNGVMQDIFPSTFTPNYVNIVTHVLHKGVEVRNFFDLVPEYDVKYIRLDRFHKAKRYYKAYKNRRRTLIKKS